ncbi:MAG: Crp/Fnr family transcriptional regulator [Gemmataceae bacterium]|nr:Crp/Fnr family transcriptional regulator [Gemmataceae bacterium]
MAHPAADRAVNGIRYFGTLKEEIRGHIADLLIVHEFPARTPILREGEVAHGFYYLDSGKARIFRAGMDGREQTFRLVEPGDTFGEVPVLDGSVNPATVETLEVSQVVLVPTKVLLMLIEQRPEVALAVLRHVARRLRTFTELVEQIGQQTVRARLSRYLYHLAREEGVQTPEGILVRRTLTQQDLASLVGSVREVVSRTLRSMAEDGVVEVRRKEILVRDLGALRESV